MFYLMTRDHRFVTSFDTLEQISAAIAAFPDRGYYVKVPRTHAAPVATIPSLDGLIVKRFPANKAVTREGKTAAKYAIKARDKSAGVCSPSLWGW